jgi:hypothetical protein
MRTGARFIVLQIASISVACMVFFGLCLQRETVSPYVSESKVIGIGETLNCEPYARATLTVKEINACVDCLLEVRPGPKVEWQWQEGRVKTGESIAFAQDLFGETTVFVGSIEKGKVCVIFQLGSGGYKYRLRFPWE